MNIAVFADVHGRVLLAFKLCARWQRETGEKIDLILQAGDLGAYSAMKYLDKATRKYAANDSSELGFLEHFRTYDDNVAAQLAETSCAMIFVRGNHEDHAWLDTLEQQSNESIFPIDAYNRIFNLKTGLLWTFRRGDEELTVLGIGRVAAPFNAENPQLAKYIHDYEKERLARREVQPLSVLLTHDTRSGLRGGLKDKIHAGMQEIAQVLDRDHPIYHFFGHYGGPAQSYTDINGVTQNIKLADLHWEARGTGTQLNRGAMGMLRWHDNEHHSFTILDEPWLREYNARSWKYM